MRHHTSQPVGHLSLETLLRRCGWRQGGGAHHRQLPKPQQLAAAAGAPSRNKSCRACAPPTQAPTATLQLAGEPLCCRWPRLPRRRGGSSACVPMQAFGRRRRSALRGAAGRGGAGWLLLQRRRPWAAPQLPLHWRLLQTPLRTSSSQLRRARALPPLQRQVPQAPSDSRRSEECPRSHRRAASRPRTRSTHGTGSSGACEPAGRLQRPLPVQRLPGGTPPRIRCDAAAAQS